ncbi:MAG: SDR family NAD(P)-dependent oxidoreductase [Bacteroidia bacterium]
MKGEKTYLLCGASSKIAESLTRLLHSKGNRTIAISTKELNNENHFEKYKVNDYSKSGLPIITEKIDGIVYFPGTINLKPFARITETEYLKEFEINALGAVNCVQQYFNNLKESNYASVVFISTVAVATGMPFHTSISMAKGAIEGLTKALAAELAPTIRVNAVAPSLTETPLSEKFINTPDKLEASQKRNPLKKIGSAEDIANAIEFLLSDKSAWITGQIMHVDGGMNNLKLL